MDFNPYFRHYFKSERFIGSLNKNLEGIRDGKMVSWQQFSDLVLPMPSPKERNTITACLSSVDVLIDAETRKLNAIESHKKGLMQQLFPAEGKTVPRLRFSEFANAREWRSATLGEFFETSSGGTPERSKAEYWGGNIPWISTSLVDFNRITQANEFITEEGMKCSSAKLFPARTILIAMYGQGQTRGKVAILDFASTTNQACAAILPQKGIDPDFVFLYLSSRYEELRALSNSGGQENLSQSLIKGFTIAIPWDTDEQKKIKLCLSRLGEVSRQQGLRVESLLRHKSGLMQQLFPVIEEVQE
jgi:type I restriction enzyme S subunit